MRTSSLLFAAVARISGTSSLPTAELERLQAWNNEVYDGTVNILVDDGEASKGSSCIWLQGNYGQALICPAYYAAAGVCGSGRSADCNGHYFELYCCDVQDVQSNCRNQGVKYGTEDQCPEGKIIAGGCGSGRSADCKNTGTSEWTEALCCDYDQLSLDYTHQFDQGAKYGVRLVCPQDYVMTTLCGSGMYADCGNDYTHMTCTAFSGVVDPVERK